MRRGGSQIDGLLYQVIELYTKHISKSGTASLFTLLCCENPSPCKKYQ